MRLLSAISLASLLILYACNNEKVSSQIDDRAAIEQVLSKQAEDWNLADIDSYMTGYWQSEELTFIGSKGLTNGWKTTLANYKNSYPDKKSMGSLTFDILQLSPISTDSYYMVGQYTLVRESDTPTGIFMLIWKKIDGKWKIIADQTCG